ncbi:MAG: glycogen/starch synthase [Candidatus Marinimicrobia bacterium]|nr:glycogen/starch synthase [Candidatus Neomarinimicrobiota bacterium]MCK4445930.1 glycogen/starch synthase [Candidatus Neomarinimicrobiota bacterium]
MVKRIYFLTSEIVPFAETYRLATFSKEIPVVFNERKYDFRLMMPRYGFISERRYILREVIRLREMDLVYKDKDVVACVKSAFIPNTKVQVYFLEHDDYYSHTDTDLYIPKVDSDTNLNSIRFGYFASAALTTLNYLRWKPEVIICNDWQMSMIPLLINSNLLNREYFDGAKVIQILHSKTPLSLYNTSEYEKVGLKDIDLTYVRDSKLDCVAASVQLCEHTMIINANDDLTEEYQKDPIFKDLFDKKNVTSYNMNGKTPEEWQKLADEIIRIIGQL